MKWISVKERLPERDTKQCVLVALRDDEGEYDYMVETWYYTRWEPLPPDTNYDDHHKVEITHWMDFPDVPTEEA